MLSRHVSWFYPNHPEYRKTHARCEFIVSIVSIVSTVGYFEHDMVFRGPSSIDRFEIAADAPERRRRRLDPGCRRPEAYVAVPGENRFKSGTQSK
jgi:hypothetical protein